MIIMALDHTSDFFHFGAMQSDPMNPDTASIFTFFTRWITHFCAPTFVFLSGISAYLSAKNKPKNSAANFLIKRGLWLILVEVLIITFGLTFNPFYNIIILQVIWAIGCSMVLLGLVSRFSHRAVLVIGLLLFFGHNLTNYLQLPAQQTVAGQLVATLMTSSVSFIPLDKGHLIGVFYAILPWTGAMFLGFWVGRWYTGLAAAQRRTYLFYSGFCLFLAFLILRYFNIYGNPQPRIVYEDGLKSLFSFLNVSKYPPSLQYYGMTLGLSVMLLAGLEKVKNRLTNILMVYGSVPFFYYVIHFYVLHILLVVIFFAKGYGTAQIASPGNPFFFHPGDLGFSLPIVYVIWLGVVGLLYRPCAWFKKYKASHSQWWLRYV